MSALYNNIGTMLEPTGYALHLQEQFPSFILKCITHVNTEYC
ncbi:hypothetical protein DFP97_10265 [Paenibacillus prosopidis]|uniref:Uncharacterized protein n=1 Tax=Paenibacillus prosopidis TaxID=630520 RepID=A0A368W532_9BACL|nr:hypothetical protein DFP97_10265 [Paenibacillus prosopidis]